VSDQGWVDIISDGAGGAIITWQDKRSGTGHIYAQRVSANGEILWTENGVPICTAGRCDYPYIVSDGSSGAIICWWYDVMNMDDIYAQKVDAKGNVLWTTNGVPICTATDTQSQPGLVGDGTGGAIICWQDFRSGERYEIYAQRVNADGVTQWEADGVRICTEMYWWGGPYDWGIIGDGSGGAIIAWEDPRNFEISDVDIYAQRVNAKGVVQWAVNGVPICTAPEYQWMPQIINDESGGAIICWDDYRGGIYAQRVDANGVPQWTTNGILIAPRVKVEWFPQIISDGSGGAIIVWTDRTEGDYYDIYAQRVDTDGIIRWGHYYLAG
jgi:hypothetical protein